MKQTLEIDGFLGISDCNIVLKKFNVVIGPQAAGKSIIARLVFFSREYLKSIFTTATEADQHKSTFDKSQKKNFYDTFPPYSWEANAFKITYSYDRWRIIISSSAGSSTIDISTSSSVATDFRNAKIAFRRHLESSESNSLKHTRGFYSEFYDFVQKKKEQDDRTYSQELDTLFVPAVRSFFSTFRDELFNILTVDKTVDPVVLNFGRYYELARKLRGRGLDQRNSSMLSDISEEIIKGKFVREEENDWIENNGRRVEVRKASSGQQEALPLLLTLSRYANSSRLLIVEEPEAHLYPTSQKSMIEFLARLAERNSCELFFTTHSPYILSSINNLILKSMVGEKFGLDPSEVTAYFIDKSGLRSIMDAETNLINAEAIDEVSADISDEFDRLVALLDE